MRNAAREAPGRGRIMFSDYRKAGVRKIWTTIRVALADHIEDKLPGITAPTLVVRGARDPIVPQRWAEEVTRLLPRGGLRVLPDLAHTLNYTAPMQLVAAIRPFLRI